MTIILKKMNDILKKMIEYAPKTWIDRFGGDETITGVLERLQRHGEPIYVRLILEEPLTLWNTVKKALGLKATQKPDAANEYYFPRLFAHFYGYN